jgi:hypothetical protein
MADNIRERFEAEALKSKVLGYVAERCYNIVPAIRKNAEFLYKCGGLSSDLSPEDKAAVLFTAVLRDIAARLETQLKTSPRLRKALSNLRHF